MHTKFWVRRAALAIVWGLAVSTWASIGHYLVGLPDVGTALVLGTMTFILLRPTNRASVPERGSNAADAAVHASAPTA
jgi:hypothetical protein